MLFKIIFSLLFILPIFGSMSVVIKAIKNELNKKNDPDKQFNIGKLIGMICVSLIGIYIGLFLVWFIWLPNIQLPFYIKLFSFFLAAPYLFGVIGFSYAMKKVTEAGGSSAKAATHISESIEELKK